MASCSPNPPDAGLPAQFIQSPRPYAEILTAFRDLTNVARDEFGHLEHAHLALAVENRAERIVGVDLRSLGLVLKTVFLDVVPKLLGQFGTRQWF